jgi:hypothetical protein
MILHVIAIEFGEFLEVLQVGLDCYPRYVIIGSVKAIEIEDQIERIDHWITSRI